MDLCIYSKSHMSVGSAAQIFNFFKSGQFLYIYIAPYHVDSMFKALHILLPQQACVVLHVYSFSITTLEYTILLAVDYTRCQGLYMVWNTWRSM